MTEDRIYELIAAYLAGETDKERNEQMREWIGKSAGNKRIFEELSAIWTYGMADGEQMEMSREAVLERVLSTVRRRRLLKPVAAAAAFAVAMSLGFAVAALTIRPGKPGESVAVIPDGEMTLTTLPGQKAEATLPDGTRVWLNSGTTITYPAMYGLEERTATLVEGEVFMDVAKKDGQLFTLNTANGLIKVHGTSFDARNYSGDSSMTVSLEEGSIEYYSEGENPKAIMTPGQKLLLDKASGSMILQSCDTEVESVWRFGELKIEEESFLDVMADMERWYGVEINISGNIPMDRYYWMTIKTESLREMLGLLSKITPLTYGVDGKNVSISIK